MPVWVLTFAYWLHMAATVAWIGGVFFQATWLAPATRRALDPAQRAALLGLLRRRFEPAAWLCLAVLFATGLTQMTAHPSYEGLLAVTSRWAAAILAKHMVIGLMLAVAALETWVLAPRWSRLALLQSQLAHSAATDWTRSQTWLARLNLTLGLIVLALTAAARTA